MLHWGGGGHGKTAVGVRREEAQGETGWQNCTRGSRAASRQESPLLAFSLRRWYGGAVRERDMRIPYGQSNFADLRHDRYFYADKTAFIPQLESPDAGYKYVLFLRPRRIGKSLLVSMLEHYYDLSRKERFDDLFKGLWIHERPTAERNEYLVLTLDFSPVNTDGGIDAIRQSFATTVKNCLRPFLMRYGARIPQLTALYDELKDYQDAAGLIGSLLSMVGGSGHRLYLLIDEYDNFANRLLADGEQALYESIVRGTGFVRSFYATLKAATGTGALARMFITGVSPILLDDLSSGFNIIRHISQKPEFNTMAGFTRADVERAVDEFLAARPALQNDPRLGDRNRLLEEMERHYDGYRFSEDATERLFNSDLVLYFLAEIHSYGRYPRHMLDLNVRTDYGRLQRIATLSGAAGAETRALLETILTEEHIPSDLVEQFGSRTMQSREQLISLFYYMGMLTFGPRPPGAAVPHLVIPNRVIRELQWEYLALAVKDQERIWIDTLDLEKALQAMAMQGDIQPLLSQFREQVVKRIGTKDLRQFNEKVLKLMLLAYISQSRMFHILSEKEFSGGYCDLFLGLSQDVPAARFAWMLEVKYLKTHAKASEVERAFTEAFQQLDRYTSDHALVPLLTLGKALKAGALVFVGAKDVLFRPWPPQRMPPKKKTLKRAARKAPKLQKGQGKRSAKR
jgi:hypothetical protein